MGFYFETMDIAYRCILCYRAARYLSIFVSFLDYVYKEWVWVCSSLRCTVTKKKHCSERRLGGVVQSLWRGLHWAGPNLRQAMRKMAVLILSRLYWHVDIGKLDVGVVFATSNSTRSTGRKSFSLPKLLCAGCYWQAAKLSWPAEIRGRRGQVLEWFFGNVHNCILEELSGGGVWASRFSQKSGVTHDDSINIDSVVKRQL